MIFSEKLTLIRRNKGYTQERLADALSVSRQAVAKWESGQSYPDITNLIQLSELFHVSVDYLVKDETCQIHPKTEEIAHEGLIEFLVEAKKHTYAGKGPKCESIRSGSHDYEYKKHPFTYIDTFYGGESFCGEEVVWNHDTPIYAMNYSGRVIGPNFSGDFLKAALLHCTQDMPYRGPHYYEENGFIYQCNVTGDMMWFQGYEDICFKGQKIYECYFHGSKIV
ncbi:XRE family transcriptional regulator [Erysipelothrix larvae]|uniref:XRE family transcriptional regulator n=1 Tax=Erysipelothrix larvae TaxID=1514105 RepID=A0A0X8H087_9FIRM|nr:DUF5680 domain-containing protein [Erysipelothrix larvae]AMC93635.1 XRE family transcriptional regulator [Erysipelothrix larvae]